VAYFSGVVHTAKPLAHHDDLRIWNGIRVIIDSTIAAYEFTEGGSGYGTIRVSLNSAVTCSAGRSAIETHSQCRDEYDVPMFDLS
jgi:hypothetical protein